MTSGDDALFLGLDAGTSGIRAVCVDRYGANVAGARTAYQDDAAARLPDVWKAGVFEVIAALSRQIALARVQGIAVDGQSGTALLCDDHGTPLSPAMFYDEPPSDHAIELLTASLHLGHQQVPATLGRITDLWSANKPGRFHAVHQADWIAGLFCGRFDFSDENNSLKLGYDPTTAGWKFDTTPLPFDARALPTVFPPATGIGRVNKSIAEQYGFSPKCQVFTGTTDGMAGFIAASGLDSLDQATAVTSLGTTLVLKTISPRRVDVAEFGIYSHKLFDKWVAGGASNAGGGALLRHFSPDEMTSLSRQIDPDVASGLDFYPLVSKGERFPVLDNDLLDRTTPRPESDVEFLAGLFESIARIEKTGFDLLREYGVPFPTSVKTVGGGSQNETWLKIRQRILGVPVVAADEAEAAHGAALLTLRGGGIR
ncbi:MAG: FGGY-family carbohydrate kinase [Rhodospirillaceae bacterium]|jgi:D-ribulokinase|nr:FGGY-family carbohydrate kinase [Rhodospirillaceae bacterium]MBT4486343.1 FGGY-family carbohydrate kinase [Rhodospirillaceae bacterium]MBT5193442.1 FGGY-family carbohydrate kinase [Rhodospirillaceae bacterium]MBT7760832.1 FGGY-family carbohydrate kinase [Rhodospirillaceae bacterium]